MIPDLLTSPEGLVIAVLSAELDRARNSLFWRAIERDLLEALFLAGL